MVDRTPSDMDALFNFGLTSTPPAGAPSSIEAGEPQYRSRRELREASGARPAAVQPSAAQSFPALPAAAQSFPALPTRRALREAQPRVRVSREVAKAARPVALAAARTARGEAAAASVAQVKRKNPLRVLVTMTAVGGLFAVAGLPAYGLTAEKPDTLAAESVQQSQSVVVGADVAATVTTRDSYSATSPEALAQQSRDAERASANAAYLASGARELGDDYPWFYELSSWDGGGLSPLNYYYRECVDFVAWRLNRDAGSYSAPFKYVWSNLTPSGGDGSQWRYAWESHGWPISDVPIAGAVASMGGNHVAYVKEVLDDGYVLLEEYNYNYSHLYGQRTVLASDVADFLYPPPR